MLIRFGYRVLNQKVVAIAQQLIGVDMGTDASNSGEDFVLSRIIASNPDVKTVFDVGGNKGDYTMLLRKRLPNTHVEIFEPNPECHSYLEELMGSTLHRVALSDKDGEMTFYTHSQIEGSAHGSLVNHFEGNRDSNYKQHPVLVQRLDTIFAEGLVALPDFMKVDTEGQDLKVLIGAGDYLKDISFIQFEFNDMHVYSRIFLKDYYDLLSDFDIYRIGNNKLIDIREYSTNYEIFRFQNILCVNNKLELDLNRFF